MPPQRTASRASTPPASPVGSVAPLLAPPGPPPSPHAAECRPSLRGTAAERRSSRGRHRTGDPSACPRCAESPSR
eukprot:scaffold239177_cov28-Tisochrysis_lutea.AAC.3